MIYFDNAATTALDPEVFETMLPYFKDFYGNPSSIHSLGRKSKAALEAARKSVAHQFQVSPSEIFFTSGGTESNNMILNRCVSDLGVKTIITSPLEHHCILHTSEELLKNNSIEKLILLDVNENGQIDINQLEDYLKTKTSPVLVTLMHANNEIGALNDIDQIAHLCKQYDTLFHTDSVQTLGHKSIDLQKTPIDFLTGSAHKFHGPKGIGLLYIRNANSLKPMIYGGAQERNMRAGTEHIYGIIGLAKALEIAYRDHDKNDQHIKNLKESFINQLNEKLPSAKINGGIDKTLSKVLNVAFPPHPKAEMLLFNLDIAGICASGGSACSSGTDIGSHVLKAIHSPADHTSIRFSFSKYNTLDEVNFTIDKLVEIFS